MYTIKEAAARTGIPIALLRAWEGRYGVVTPKRTAAGYRLYDDAALDRLRSMRALVDTGWSPSAAAAAILAGEIPVPVSPTVGPPATVGASPGDHAVDRIEAFVDAAIDLDSARLEGVLDEMLAQGSFEQVASSELLPALTAIGDGWAEGRVGIAGEHAASHAVLRRLSAAFQAAGRPGARMGAVLVGLPPGSRHELGALAFAVAARRAGLPVLYLGPDLPAADWVATATETGARAVVIGSPTAADADAAIDVAAALGSALPDLAIALGGHGAPEAAARLADRGTASVAPVAVLPDALVEAVDVVRATIGPTAG